MNTNPETSNVSINIDDIPSIPLTGPRYEVQLGSATVATVAAGETDGAAEVFILTPPLNAPSGVGGVYNLTQSQAVTFAEAIHASLTEDAKRALVQKLAFSGKVELP